MINRLRVLSTVYILSICLLTACGGGGGETSNPSTGMSRITVNDITEQRVEYKEGETVALSLYTADDSSEDINFNWRVTFGGQELEFIGQNTASISFLAPDVEHIGTVDVSVEIDLNNGRLLGERRQYHTLRIVDLDPVSPQKFGVIKPGLKTELPEVGWLEFNNISSETVWLLNTYVLTPTNHLGFTGEQYFATQIITYFELNQREDLRYRRCGRDVHQSFYSSRPNSDIAPICSGSLQRKYYQSEGAFRIEDICDGRVEFAANFTKLSDDTNESFGSVELDLSSHDDLQATAPVCGLLAEAITVSHEDHNGDGNPDNAKTAYTIIEANTEYKGESIQLISILDDVDDYWIYSLFDFWGEDSDVSFTINSDALERINGQEAEDGSLRVDRDGEMAQIEVDAEFYDVNGSTEDVTSNITLRFH